MCMAYFIWLHVSLRDMTYFLFRIIKYALMTKNNKSRNYKLTKKRENRISKNYAKEGSDPLKSDFKGDRTKLTKQKKLECCPYLQPILYANTRFSPLSQSGSTFYCRSSTTREGCGSPAPLCRPAASNYFFLNPGQMIKVSKEQL